MRSTRAGLRTGHAWSSAATATTTPIRTGRTSGRSTPTAAASHSSRTAAAAGGEPPELATSNLNTRAGKLTALKAGVTYQASEFPIALRVTPTDGTWAGTQWKTSSHGQPAFGWTAFGQGPPNKGPLG